MLGERAELLFVDGGSADQSVRKAEEFGRVIASVRNRGKQKNAGAAHGTSDFLLFLHADTEIDPAVLPEVEKVLSNGYIGGCFRMKVLNGRLIYRIFEWVVNMRARLSGIIDGDLGFFVRKDIFLRAGQFDPLPYMEDIFFSKKIAGAGKLITLDAPIKVSSRRWDEQGFWKTLFRYAWAYVQFWTGTLK